jgi:hypothetical protein
MKISIKKFFSREPEDTNSVEIKVEVEEKRRTELFNEAVKSAVRDRCRNDLRMQLTEMCYTQEEIEQTEAARLEGKWTDTMRANYPKASIIHSVYESRPGLVFVLDEFIDKLLEDVV